VEAIVHYLAVVTAVVVHFLAGVAVYVVHFITVPAIIVHFMTVPAITDSRYQLGPYPLGHGNNNTMYMYILNDY
jgi:hypothetical protein